MTHYLLDAALLVLLLISSVHASHIQGVSDTESSVRSHDGILQLLMDKNETLRLYGSDLSSTTASLQLTTDPIDCDSDLTELYSVIPDSRGAAFVSINFNIPDYKGLPLYICYAAADGQLEHQGNSSWVTLTFIPAPPKSILPLPLEIIFLAILLCMSGLFSGLNLGLMSLDPMDLQIVMTSGTKSDQKCAKKIYPIRKKGNFLLCTVLLCNVLVNNTLTILLNDLVSGLYALIGATAAIVVFGEILPQAVCSRYGLQIGASTLWLTKIFMALTFIASWPISKILDFILGEEIGTIYNRTKLLEMLKVTDPYNDLEKDEVNIIRGALELKSKTVQDVMTPLDDCYMIEICALLDFETMRDVMAHGYTRIPVYEGERHNVCGVLFVKDLAFVDPDDCMSVRTVCDFYQHPLHFVFNDISLDKLLDEFKSGANHMAIVHEVTDDGNTDPHYDVLGVVTMEDVIEEIIKSEIVDETDVITDNITKQPNMMRHKIPVDLSLFGCSDEEVAKKRAITPQQSLAALKFLRSELEAFRKVSEKVLLRLLRMHDVIVMLKLEENENNEEKSTIYKRNKMADYFILILEGEVQVTVGKENLQFASGPFSYYGASVLQSKSDFESSPQVNRAFKHDDETTSFSNALQHQAFLPDYTLQALGDCKYIKITRKQFNNALRTTKMAEIGSESPAMRHSTLPLAAKQSSKT